MVFPVPQWSWRIEYEPVLYGFVSNTVRICPERGREVETYVKVPTELFQLMPLLFTGEALSHAQAVGCTFYMDEDEKWWVMGLETNDGKYNIDLWPYTKSQLPPWFDAAFRRRP